MTGNLVGTPYFMSPEQIKGERPTVASDIYQLGASFYHATTGQPPFGGEHIAKSFGDPR